jgi:hypothetical protein
MFVRVRRRKIMGYERRPSLMRFIRDAGAPFVSHF